MKKFVNYLLLIGTTIGLQLPLWISIDYIIRFKYPIEKQILVTIFLILGICHISTIMYKKKDNFTL